MKTTQVASGFVLGASLLLHAAVSNALVVFDDGAVHSINDESLLFEYVEVRNGSTLRLESGAVVGGPFDESGVIFVHDTSSVVVAGARLGGDGGSTGIIYLNGNSRLVIEGGVIGGAGPSSGQVAAFDQSAVVILDGDIGGAGSLSGVIGLSDASTGEVHGGRFGGTGEFSGLLYGYGASQAQFFICESGVPPGPIAAEAGTLAGVSREGVPVSVQFVREPTAVFTLVEDCDGGGDVDTDGDGVPDRLDLCPQSDLHPTVRVFDIDTRIPNLIHGRPVNAEGCSLADVINHLLREAWDKSRNRGEFLRAVMRGLRELRRDGLLPHRFHGHFLNCAVRARWNSR
ncbi:MAG TPA: hypothetical protein DCY13_10125 [Verrucomicrobiales bacterium]|nr:hypothetical protein [Verrucomicrobiales bacterium]